MSHSSDPEVRASLTEYQDIALRAWIPESAGNPDSPGLKAAHLLADLLNEHGDTWLNDFLKALQPGDAAGLQALSAAITNNKKGLITAGQAEAERAVKIFENRNLPATLRARFEIIYSNQRALEGEYCLKHARELERDLQATSYRWLQIQVTMQKGVCLNFNGEFHAAGQYMKEARDAADHAGYPFLKLRAMSLAAGMKVSLDPDASWQEALQGMAEYWKGPDAPDKLYELLTIMKRCLVRKGHLHAARAFEQEMIELLEKVDAADENLVLQATAHSDLSSIYLKLDETKNAGDEAELAGSISRKIPSGETAASRYGVPIQVQRAKVQLEHDANAAAEILKQVEPLLKEIHDDLIVLDFITVRGEVFLSMGRFDRAENTYKQGLELAEKDLAHLHGRHDRQKWVDETGELYRGLVKVFLEQKQDMQALQLWRWYQARPLAVVDDVPRGNVSWSGIQGQVFAPVAEQKSGARIVYASMKDSLYAWTIKGTEVKAFAIPEKQKTLKDRITRYSEMCSIPQFSKSDIFDQSSKELFAVLLQPLMPVIHDVDTLAVELDHPMDGVLLETLKNREGGYLGQQYAVVYSPGWTSENALRPFANAERGVFLDAQPRDIPEVQELEKTVSALYPRLAPIDPSDKHAWRDALPASEMLLFFGHGRSHGLVYGNNQILKAEDFPAESLSHLQLVALIACSTGSPNHDLVPTDDLVSAFLSAGASNVVASNWDVDSRATVDLMEAFLHSLKNGKTVANAMYEARKSIFNAYPDPFYWAGFSVSGKSN